MNGVFDANAQISGLMCIGVIRSVYTAYKYKLHGEQVCCIISINTLWFKNTFYLRSSFETLNKKCRSPLVLRSFSNSIKDNIDRSLHIYMSYTGYILHFKEFNTKTRTVYKIRQSTKRYIHALTKFLKMH